LSIFDASDVAWGVRHVLSAKSFGWLSVNDRAYSTHAYAVCVRLISPIFWLCDLIFGFKLAHQFTMRFPSCRVGGVLHLDRLGGVPLSVVFASAIPFCGTSLLLLGFFPW